MTLFNITGIVISKDIGKESEFRIDAGSLKSGICFDGFISDDKRIVKKIVKIH